MRTPPPVAVRVDLACDLRHDFEGPTGHRHGRALFGERTSDPGADVMPLPVTTATLPLSLPTRAAVVAETSKNVCQSVPLRSCVGICRSHTCPLSLVRGITSNAGPSFRDGATWLTFQSRPVLAPGPVGLDDGPIRVGVVRVD